MFKQRYRNWLDKGKEKLHGPEIHSFAIFSTTITIFFHTIGHPLCQSTHLPAKEKRKWAMELTVQVITSIR